MAVTQELLNKISLYEKEGYTADEILQGLSQSKNYPDVAAKITAYVGEGYGTDEILQGIKASPVGEPGLGSRVVSKVKEAFSEAANPDPRLTLTEKNIRFMGGLGEAAGDVMMTGAGTAYKAVVPESVQQGVSGAVGWLADTDIGKSVRQTFGDVGRVWGGVRGAAPETAKDVEAALQTVNLIPAVAGAKTVYPAAKEGVLVAADAARIAAPKLVEAGRAVKQVVKPSLNPDEALGHVLQGKTKDLVKGKEAIKALDVKGVKTYADLKKRIDEAIPEYSRKVDAELMKDPTPRKLDQLATTQATQGGKAVTTNYVETAMNNLKELYEKTAQPVKAAEIDELMTKATTEGLTKKEVNDLARVYGSEFTAFNPTTGAPPTTVTKQLYENVRKGLKDVSRSGLSDEAKNLDAIISSLYNTRRLIDKNVEAYNRINQKTTPRGIPERMGGAAMNILDYATLGSLKGAVSKLIPRNAGYKLQNYLDLEKNLEKNLKIVTKEIERQEKGAFQPWSQTGKAIAEVTRGDMNEALGVLKPAETPAAVRLVEPPTRPKGAVATPQESDIITPVTPKKGTANIPPETNPKAVGGELISRESTAGEGLAYNPQVESSGNNLANEIQKRGGKILGREEISRDKVVGLFKDIQETRGAIEKIHYVDADGRNKYAYVKYSWDGVDSLGEESIVAVKEIPPSKINEFFKQARKEYEAFQMDQMVKAKADPNSVTFHLSVLRKKIDTNNKAIIKEYSGDFDKAYNDPRWMSDRDIYEQAKALASKPAPDLFTPDKAESIIYRKLKGPENEWIEQQLANLNEKIDSRAVEESRGDIQRGISDALRAKGIDPEANAALIDKELSDFFSEVTNPIQSTGKNAGGKAAPKGGGGSLIDPELLQELSERLKGGLK